MSQHNAKLFSPSLILASAALLIHISVATAADSKGDIPQQAKESRAGTTKAHYRCAGTCQAAVTWEPSVSWRKH